MFEIRTDIPIPGSRTKFPEVLKLKVGESVWYPKSMFGNNQPGAYFSAGKFADGGKKYMCRTWTKNGTVDRPVKPGDMVGFRIWRIK